MFSRKSAQQRSSLVTHPLRILQRVAAVPHLRMLSVVCVAISLAVSLAAAPAFQATEAGFAADGVGASGCRVVELDSQILGTDSAVWVGEASGSSSLLAVADFYHGGLRSVALSDPVRPDHAKVVDINLGRLGVKPSSYVARVQPRGNEMWVEKKPDAAIEVYDAEYRKLDSFNARISLSGKGDLAGYTVEELRGWSPLGDGLVAFADVRMDADWKRALLYYDRNGNHVVAGVYEVADPITYQYTALNLGYTTSDARFGYALQLEETIRIVRFDPRNLTVETLGAFPREFERRLIYKPDRWMELAGRGAELATDALRLLERSPAAVSLHVWNDSLYVVGKSAMGSTSLETSWVAIELDPTTGGEVARYPLPTTAAHLLVVPSDDWLLLEKGPVSAVGAHRAPFMNISSAVVVPSGWLAEGSGPLVKYRGRDRGQLVKLCRPEDR